MRINIKVVALTIIFLFLIEPDYFTSIEIIHVLYVGMRFFTIFIAIIYILIKKQIPKVTLILLLYFLIYAYATYINDGNLLNLFNYSMSIISFVIWIEIILKNHPLQGLQSLNITYILLVYLNLLFFIIFPNGYEYIIANNGDYVSRYFLGVYNQFAATLIPAVIVNIVYTYMRYKTIKLQSIILLITVLFTFIYFWSATSLVGIALIVVYLILFRKSIFNLLVKVKVIIPIIIGLFVMIVGFNNLGVFSFFIENILDKDVTLSTRTIIWDAAIEMIKESPYFGYGYLGDGSKYITFGSGRQRDAHNTILQYMLQHGIVGFIPLILLMILFIKNLVKQSGHYITKFILFSFFTATTMMLSEVYAFRYLLIIIILGIYIPNIIREQENILSKDLK